MQLTTIPSISTRTGFQVTNATRIGTSTQPEYTNNLKQTIIQSLHQKRSTFSMVFFIRVKVFVEVSIEVKISGHLSKNL